MKMIGVEESLHKRIKELSNLTGKKIYRLIEEAIEYLEKKYISEKNKKYE